LKPEKDLNFFIDNKLGIPITYMVFISILCF
jgi:hypothetical protein